MIDSDRESARLRGLVTETLAERTTNRTDAEHLDRNTRFLQVAAAIAGRCERLFSLRCVDAPGLYLVGSEIDLKSPINTTVVSASGKGLNEIDALVSCLGEAAEYLSLHDAFDSLSIRTGSVPDSLKPPDEALTDLLAMVGGKARLAVPESWITARRLVDDKEFWIPASLGTRDRMPDNQPPVPSSTGCAVADTMQNALLHGLLEVVERDAVALWWLGGKQPVALAAELVDQSEVTEFLLRLRRGKVHRNTWLIDISTDLGVPCVAALSCDKSGRGLACGFGARLTWHAAAKAAILEMGQIEMALRIVELKRKQRGASALNEADRTHLRRADIDVSSQPLLSPTAGTHVVNNDIRNIIGGQDSLQALVKRIHQYGIEPLYINLTSGRLPGVAACRVLAPGLQVLNPSIRSNRLKSQIALTGGGPGVDGNHPLV